MSAKDIIVKPISSQDARRIVKKIHYSGKVANNSQLHFGVFLDGKCGGVMQFGPSLDKRTLMPLVSGTRWNNFLELNRMAFADWLPRNSESRAISVAMRLIRKAYPHIEWIASFADGTQCGDGAIYRASGFVLTAINESKSLWRMPDGEVVHEFAFRIGGIGGGIIKKRYGYKEGENRNSFLARSGVRLKGFQLRYIYFLNPAARSRLTCPVIPFSEIERRGAGMYLGKPKRASSETSDTPGFHPGKGGATPTDALQYNTL